LRNLSAGGEHLHHYLWGIGLLAGVGAIASAGSYFAALPVLRATARKRPGNEASIRHR
jgi:hypothetical protein